MVFEWGVDKMPARAALVDLMSGSRTTMSWRLHCGAYWNDMTCFFTMMPLQVGPTRRIVAFDRCTNCQKMPIDQLPMSGMPSPTFALGHIFRQKVFCFQWAGRQGLHYILS